MLTRRPFAISLLFLAIATRILPGSAFAYLDNALAAADLSEAESHLAGCPECDGRLTGLRILIAGLTSCLNGPWR